MKHIPFLLLLIFCVQGYAGAPQAFTYQAIARDSTGNVLQLKQLGFRFSIHDGSPNGSIVYQETDTVTTDRFGLLAVAIDSGIIVQGNFPNIDWTTGNKYLQVEMDPSGGSNYTNMGTSQLLSVPYSLHAHKSDTSINANYSDTSVFASKSDTALYSMLSALSLNAIKSDTALYASKSDTSIYSIKSDTSFYASKSDTAVYSIQSITSLNSVKSDSSLFANRCDTSNYSLSSDTSSFAAKSDTAVYAQFSAGSNWSDYANYDEETASGSSTLTTLTNSTWAVRQIGNTLSQAGPSISRVGANITLQPGTYYIAASAQWGLDFAFVNGQNSGWTTAVGQLRLRNTTSGTSALMALGQSFFTIAPTITGSVTRQPYCLTLEGVITVTSPSTFNLQHYVTFTTGGSSSVSADAGNPVSTGDNEVYSNIIIRRID